MMGDINMEKDRRQFVLMEYCYKIPLKTLDQQKGIYVTKAGDFQLLVE